MSETIAGRIRELERDLVAERVQRMQAEQRAGVLERVGEHLTQQVDALRHEVKRLQGVVNQQEP